MEPENLLNIANDYAVYVERRGYLEWIGMRFVFEIDSTNNLITSYQEYRILSDSASMWCWIKAIPIEFRLRQIEQFNTTVESK